MIRGFGRWPLIAPRGLAPRGRASLWAAFLLAAPATLPAQTPIPVLHGEEAAVLVSVAITPDGSRLVCGSTDHHVRVWNGRTGELEQSLKLHEGSVPGLALSPDGRLLASGGYDDQGFLTELAGPRRLHTFAGHTADINGAALSADGRLVLTGSDDDTARLWDARTGRLLRTLAGHADNIWNVALTADGTRAVTASGDDTLGVWNTADGRRLLTLEGHTGGVNVVAVTPDGGRIVSGAGDRLVKIWDGRGGGHVRDLAGHADQIWAIAVSDDGRLVASGGGSADKSVRVWETMTGRQLHLFPDFGSAIFGLKFTADGSRLAAASGDGTLRLFDLAAGRERVKLAGMKNSSEWVALTPEGDFSGSQAGIENLLRWRVPGVEELQRTVGEARRLARPESVSRAINPRGAAAEVPAPLPTEEGGNRWALLIGVNDYVAMRDLEYAVNDVHAVAERLLASGFAADHLFLLSDRAEDSRYRPTRANIERELKLVLALAEPKDLVIVSFHGHGVHVGERGFLCPNDSDLRSPETTMLPLDGKEGVYEQLTKCRASLKVMLVDACRNDPRPPGRRSSDPESDSTALNRTFQRPPDGVLVLSSCAQGQVSLEHGDLGHGVFTHFLLEGLAGKADAETGDRNRRVSLLELFKYTNERTKVYAARKFSEFQTPELYGRVTGDFELGSVFGN